MKDGMNTGSTKTAGSSKFVFITILN